MSVAQVEALGERGTIAVTDGHQHSLRVDSPVAEGGHGEGAGPLTHLLGAAVSASHLSLQRGALASRVTASQRRVSPCMAHGCCHLALQCSVDCFMMAGRPNQCATGCLGLQHSPALRVAARRHPKRFPVCCGHSEALLGNTTAQSATALPRDLCCWRCTLHLCIPAWCGWC